MSVIKAVRPVSEGVMLTVHCRKEGYRGASSTEVLKRCVGVAVGTFSWPNAATAGLWNDTQVLLLVFLNLPFKKKHTTQSVLHMTKNKVSKY